MSYDVTIADKSFNYTWNLAPLFYDHIPQRRARGGLSEIDGLTGAQAAVVLSECFECLHRTYIDLCQDDVIGAPKFCSKYDAKNGWGSAVGALIFLAKVLAECAQHPRHKVRVC